MTDNQQEAYWHIVPGAPFAAEYWYRIEDQRYASSLDEWEDPSGRGSAGLTC